MIPPSGTLTTFVTPLTRVTGISSLCGLIATAACAFELRSPSSVVSTVPGTASISTSPTFVPESIMPGKTNCPEASITTADCGVCTLPGGPNAAIFPFAMTSVAFGIGAAVTGTMVTLRMTMVCFFPGLFGIVDCARSESDVQQSTAIISLRILLLLLLVLLLRLVRFFLQPLFLLAFHRGALVEIALAVEEDLAFDHGRVDARVDGQRMAGPDHEVGVFAHFDRADAVVDAQLLRAVNGAEAQRFVVAEASVFDRLRRVVIEMARELVGVGVDGGEHAVAHHQRDVVRNGVVRLGLVAPPVDERAAAGAVRGDLTGDFVAFEDVLQLADLESQLVGEIEQHHDLVRAVAVRMDVDVAAQDVGHRLHQDVAARRNRGLFALLLCLVFVPRGQVVARVGE